MRRKKPPKPKNNVCYGWVVLGENKNNTVTIPIVKIDKENDKIIAEGPMTKTLTIGYGVLSLNGQDGWTPMTGITPTVVTQGDILTFSADLAWLFVKHFTERRIW